MASSAVKCKRCGTAVKSFSPMRKWCFDCRKRVTVEQARDRKGRLKVSSS